MALAATTDADFAADVLASSTPVLVDFTATQCGPCKMIAPVLEQIATDEAGRLSVVTVDVDANPHVTRDYQVMGTPTLALFVGGQLVERLTGAKPRAAILRALDPHLSVG
ncbi:thioredoxin family protein [Rhodococcus sp. NPDC059234]|uniref:thioredoxin family protein n=1 Tax=Rhodococcus sp. NPDC059234 TaxID=3346781 RepID=UPI00366CC3BC